MHTPGHKLQVYSLFPHLPSLGSKHGSLEGQASCPSGLQCLQQLQIKLSPIPQGASDAQTEIELEFIEMQPSFPVLICHCKNIKAVGLIFTKLREPVWEELS